MMQIYFGKDRYHEIQEMISWLFRNVGHGGYIDDPEGLWKIEQAFGTSVFTFVEEKDATLFALRWT